MSKKPKETQNHSINYNLKQIAKVWKECYGEDLFTEYKGFITKLKERQHEL
jgi:hypothetical protein